MSLPFYLETKMFTTIVDFYDLKDAINYYHLFNKSRYMNSYHGFNHVKRILCAVWYFTREFQYDYKTIREYLIAGIFHDFDYISNERETPNFDEKNIEVALKAYKRYIYLLEEKKGTPLELGNVLELIASTEYPNCFLSKNERHALLINADHSMVFFRNYPMQVLMFYLNEWNNTSKENFITDVNAWFEKVTFLSSALCEKWKKQKEQIRQDVFNFLEQVLIRYSTLENFKKEMCISNEFAKSIDWEIL